MHKASEHPARILREPHDRRQDHIEIRPVLHPVCYDIANFQSAHANIAALCPPRDRNPVHVRKRIPVKVIVRPARVDDKLVKPRNRSLKGTVNGDLKHLVGQDVPGFGERPGFKGHFIFQNDLPDDSEPFPEQSADLTELACPAALFICEAGYNFIFRIHEDPCMAHGNERRALPGALPERLREGCPLLHTLPEHPGERCAPPHILRKILKGRHSFCQQVRAVSAARKGACREQNAVPDITRIPPILCAEDSRYPQIRDAHAVDRFEVFHGKSLQHTCSP